MDSSLHFLQSHTLAVLAEKLDQEFDSSGHLFDSQRAITTEPSKLRAGRDIPSGMERSTCLAAHFLFVLGQFVFPAQGCRFGRFA
jgi:hypothetical protein